MSQDKELKIQLQFLDEAQEYLSTLEAAVLGSAGSQVDVQKVNAALRAAHSIKGGAGMMGFQTLSQLAHRLEDSLKVLKIQRQTIEVDAELERLLLSGLDCLHQIIYWERQRTPVDSHWLNTQAEPVFEQLHQRLGDPTAEDAASMLASEEGQDILPLLFETEVEGCLQRLETVLVDDEQPCLLEEVTILAQELGGLGEMLQLTPFVHLCESISRHLEAAPDQAEEVAQLALQAWRRSQALVLTGQIDMLPEALEGASFSVPRRGSFSIPAETAIASESWEDWTQTDEYFLDIQAEDVQWGEEIELDDVQFDDTQVEHVQWGEEGSELDGVQLNDIELDDVQFDDTQLDGIELDNTQVQNVQVEHVQWGEEGSELDGVQLNDIELDNTQVENAQWNDEGSEVDDTQINDTQLDVKTASLSQVDHQQSTPILSTKPLRNSAHPVRQSHQTASREFQTTGFRVLEVKPDSASSPNDTQETTVRVPLHQLNQLNDLFGELTIERNSLDLQLKRLRNLTYALNHKVQILNQANLQLRATYDKASTQNTVPSVTLPLLAAATVLSPTITTDENQRVKGITSRFDALEMDRYSDLHLLSQEVMETIVQIQEVTDDIELSLDDTDQTARDLRKTSGRLQTKLSQVRMRPLSDIVNRFPRALRDLSLQYGKKVELKIYGSSTLIDRNILESLNDPLMHLLRNAFDHGIEDPEARKAQGKPEQGVIEIRATHRSNRTLISIRDDGRGISLDKIRDRARQMGLDAMLLAAASDEELLSLIFEPGFSTTDQVTDLSGRGVGMDVVRNSLQQIRGDINVSTKAGVGTTFTLSVPFTLSVARVLLAESNGILMAFPTDTIEEMLVLEPEAVFKTVGSEAFNWSGMMVPLVRLSHWLEFHCPCFTESLETPPAISTPTILMINLGTQLMGLEVDRCWTEQEVAIRQIEGNLPMPPGFTGCTILGDGRVVPLVNASDLLHWIISCDRSGKGTVAEPPYPKYPSNNLSTTLYLTAADEIPTSALPPAQKQTILVIDDSINVRRLLALTLEKAGYQVEQAKDGQDAVEKLTSGLPVQAVICDIEMPRLDGYGFLAQIKSNPTFESLPVTMLTSRSGEKHRQLAMSLGASAYFSKPYNEQALLKTLEQLMSLTPVA